MQTVMKRKLNVFVYICRMRDNRLVKIVMFVSMDGKPMRGRPHREWLDDITDWCGMELHQLIELAQTCTGWRQTVSCVLDTS